MFVKQKGNQYESAQVEAIHQPKSVVGGGGGRGHHLWDCVSRRQHGFVCESTFLRVAIFSRNVSTRGTCAKFTEFADFRSSATSQNIINSFGLGTFSVCVQHLYCSHFS